MKRITASVLMLLLLLFAACSCSKSAGDNAGSVTAASCDSVPENLIGEWKDKSDTYTLTINADSLKISRDGEIVSRCKIKITTNPELTEQSDFIVERETGGFIEPFTEFRIMDDGTLTTVTAAPGGVSVDYIFVKQ